LIEDVSFDGRKRVIRSLINRYVDKAQSKAGLDKNPSRVGQKSNPGLDENPSGVPPLLIYDSKEDKEEDIARTAAQPHKKGAEISFSFDQGKFQNICPEDLEAWKELYNSTDVERELKEMVQWIIANKSKSKHKTLWRKFILGWLQRANEKSINRSAYQSSKEKQVLSRHTGFKKDEREVHPSRTIDLSED
jgi:hypothetical protein